MEQRRTLLRAPLGRRGTEVRHSQGLRRMAKFVSFPSHAGVALATLGKRETPHPRPRGHPCLQGGADGLSSAPSPALRLLHGSYSPGRPPETARAFSRPLFRGGGRRVGRVPYDSSPQPPRSRLGSPPRPESPCGMQPPPRVMRHPWDAGRDGGSGRSGICVQEENKAGDYRSGASILEVQTPARSPRRSRYRHSCLGGPLLYPPPPPRNPSSRPRRTTRSSEHAGSHPSPSITRAPSSPRARAPLALSARSTPVPPSAAKAAAPCHPRPARPLSQPGSPASCAATAARDPPPSRLPLSCLFRSTNNFCSDAGSLGPRRPLLPASPPSGPRKEHCDRCICAAHSGVPALTSCVVTSLGRHYLP
ncbi:serine/arginine repetitive matrix protein 1-like isoform X2 [Sus scrofa]|uniref:serine/arginine repetitive matrix protein 1-like isoform X2 n=1 Tax=Sus scrofa TaxID=9823 RepID=UPI000A2B442B|nr:serine/arginine repetitive matrix protein 1-like isoform X2 [Sus scrofa]